MRTILEAGRALRGGETTSVELTQECLSQIAAQQPSLNAFVTVVADLALAQAAERDKELAQGRDRGALHGIPIALKDVFETKGIRTTCGSLLFADNVPERDSAVGERLERAGCVLLGKTGMHELAYGVTSNNPHFGTIRNPWNPAHIPGGSSGGSGAAVASGMCFMAMGSDTGGSIRIPAAFCGTVGLKPTYGRVSRYGVMPLDFTLDHMGPLTRCVRDAGVVLEALAGADDRDHTSSNRAVEQYVPPAEVSIRGMRLGVPENFYFDRSEPEVIAAVRSWIATAERLGAVVTPVQVPDIAGLNVLGRIILFAEATSTMEPYLERREQFGADVLSLFDQGKYILGSQYVQAQRLRRVFQLEFQKLFEQVDCIVTPATPLRAPRIGDTTIVINGSTEDTRLAATRFVRGINVLGLPALTMPCGVSGGLPMSVQIIGKAFDEKGILAVGAAVEDAMPYSRLTPPGL